MGKEVTKKGNEALVKSMGFEEEAGGGFENADADSFAIPFLKILQKLSPQCDADKEQYIESAKPGFLFNTVTQEVFDANEGGIYLIPCFYDRNYTKWTPKELGGGFKGIEKPGSPEVANASPGEGGALISLDGLELHDTRYHYCLLEVNGNYSPVLVAMSSSQIKKSRGWMGMMNNVKLDGANGKFTPPTFSHRYKVGTLTEAKDDNTWKGWKIEMGSMLGENDADLYQAAKAFRDQIRKGAAKVEYDRGNDDSKASSATNAESQEDF